MRRIIAILLILLCAGGLESCRDSKLKSSKSPNNTIVGVQKNDDTLQNLQTNEDSGSHDKGLNEIRFAFLRTRIGLTMTIFAVCGNIWMTISAER